MIETTAAGSELASWTPLVVLLVAYAAIVVALTVTGRGSLLERAPDALHRLTGIPGWAAAAVGTAMFGLLVAGQGFYSDVAWHIALGRDEVLFTAPHTSIVVGLGFILLASAIGTTFATVGGVETPLRVGALRVPWSMVPLAVLGLSALSGFPLDEVWHAEFGVDVTMWSPTHMLMILGASFTGLALWLVLADARVGPRDSRWARGVHVVAAWLTLQGLAASQGEFSFGVPQFQQIFHPVLVTIAAALALVAIRVLHGRGWALGIALGAFAFSQFDVFGDSGPVATREGGIYLASALVVELVAVAVGIDRRLRFGVLSGVGVATFGLAGEWAWNQGAPQPWRASLLPDALALCLVVGVGAAVLGVAFGGALLDGATRGGIDTAARASRVPRVALVAAGLAVVVGVLLPMPRSVGDVTAAVALTPVGDGSTARVAVTLDPPDAAADARWFQVVAWQGGGLALADLHEVGPGRYETREAVPVTGRAKTMVRLQRGGELMAVPVYFPADPAIGEPEIPAVDRTVAFSSETQFLLRETRPGSEVLGVAVHLFLAAVVALWAATFVLVAGRVGTRGGGGRPRPSPAPGRRGAPAAAAG